MDTNSQPLANNDNILTIEVPAQKELKNRLPVSSSLIRFFRIFFLVNYLLFGALLGMFMEIDKFAELGKELYFWVFCLSFVYFVFMVIQDHDKMESNYISGTFHALWALSLTSLVISAFFVAPFHERKDNLPLLFEIITGLFVFFTLSLDFVINKLLIQKVIAAVVMTIIILLYGSYVAYQHFGNEIELPDMLNAKGYYVLLWLLIYKMLNEFIWMTYTYVHPYKFKLIEGSNANSTINLETVNVSN